MIFGINVLILQISKIVKSMGFQVLNEIEA
jgi:hypothetical protein